jgi:hypothetical protein
MLMVLTYLGGNEYKKTDDMGRCTEAHLLLQYTFLT